MTLSVFPFTYFLSIAFENLSGNGKLSFYTCCFTRVLFLLHNIYLSVDSLYLLQTLFVWIELDNDYLF